MYQKSAKAGSQSGIGRINGNGEVCKSLETDEYKKPEVFLAFHENEKYISH